ncbi:DUF255 domain-containing protein [Paenibacillus sp. P46E]|uniref:DUF255 domain-containing protein n=1 Tax=Paenibacillus sp. P46E TaxID=1349436 RepID=UPI00095C2E3B|nr:DUF255 domain-containing protein [Paenibacillus sp. P46E]OKP99307.1 hypothetical protein A3849_05065 [Paenibacillus sp. P46E]
MVIKEGQQPNRFIYEESPYLLQHAHNPVDWYLWGKEAFTKAKSENKPIFLSVGQLTIGTTSANSTLFTLSFTSSPTKLLSFITFFSFLVESILTPR